MTAGLYCTRVQLVVFFTSENTKETRTVFPVKSPCTPWKKDIFMPFASGACVFAGGVGVRRNRCRPCDLGGLVVNDFSLLTQLTSFILFLIHDAGKVFSDFRVSTH